MRTIQETKDILYNNLNIFRGYTQEEAEQVARAYMRHDKGIEFGMEYISVPEQSMSPSGSFAYVNMGDTYDETLILKNGEWFFSCWGDELEKLEAEHTADHGEDRCGYCGEWKALGETCHDEATYS